MPKEDQSKEKSQEDQVEQGFKKKIIKKMPFKIHDHKTQEEDLKNWKPTKISERVEQKRIKEKLERKQLANTFLSNLPKPSQNLQIDSTLKSISYKPLHKGIVKMEPTAEQIKWDIEDQSFIKKQFTKIEAEHELEEQEEEEVIVDKIEWLNEDKDKKIKEIDLTKVIDNDWKQAVHHGKIINDVWNTGLTQGRGQISQFVRDAIEKFDQDQLALNQKSLNKKKVKSRYGW